jgi:purine-binding chemotaxis protein CheW
MTELAVKSTPHSFCTFRLAGQLYGIEISAVREVTTGLLIAPVPHAPAEVRGLANLRSRIYVLLDLRLILGLAPAVDTAETRVVILKDNVSENAGLVVDKGGDIVSVGEEAMEKNDGRGGDVRTELPPLMITSICKLPEELLMVVDPVRITDHVKMKMA